MCERSRYLASSSPLLHGVVFGNNFAQIAWHAERVMVHRVWNGCKSYAIDETIPTSIGQPLGIVRKSQDHQHQHQLQPLLWDDGMVGSDFPDNGNYWVAMEVRNGHVPDPTCQRSSDGVHPIIKTPQDHFRLRPNGQP